MAGTSMECFSSGTAGSNYFVVLAYRYTTILSAQLINFWAIVVVVIISFLILRVRYHWTQVMGILICCGGMGLLLASDHITGSNGGTAANQLKGDLFMLLGSSFYGVDNVLEEFLVSKRPLYEVVGQIGFWGTIISGAQAGIFDRAAFRSATWDGQVGGYLVGYTGCLFVFFYKSQAGALHSPFLPGADGVVEDSFTPIMFRMSSAAFFNISLLTGNFWGVAIGKHVFGLHIHYLYPIAFVLIMVGEFSMKQKMWYSMTVANVYTAQDLSFISLSPKACSAMLRNHGWVIISNWESAVLALRAGEQSTLMRSCKPHLMAPGR
ncbi:hypothetical protein GP486_001599 [Trichoglossum hirsutum]|uniref:Solute carrier family 35 member F1 n=1 Tax=Trichoglossum hirsutum TaxID=265104 RepID=A0A9P8LGV8_9PEZI|nr:hypothetical protein GP486_001599 [Trichoglossum hirsutum]